ncbi:ABC-type glycerol-3-phosphate transport system permease component [Bacillus sp. SORGH_AS 510]|nr:ABC-type glycerol-3-phosphate transport system permease component [Bacillus sp. SORGH_AS_0510]
MDGAKKKGVWLRYVLAVVLLLVMIFPYIYMVLNSFADWDQVDKKLIPTQFSLKSYEWLLGGGEAVIPRPWISAFFNSFLVSAGSTFLMMVTGVMVAYALGQNSFQRKRHG